MMPTEKDEPMCLVGGPRLRVLHAQEMVLPAHLGEPMRRLFAEHPVRGVRECSAYSPFVSPSRPEPWTWAPILGGMVGLFFLGLAAGVLIARYWL